MSITVINNIYGDDTPPEVRTVSRSTLGRIKRDVCTVATEVTRETRDWLFQEAANINASRESYKRYTVADLLRDYIAQAREVAEELDN